ncbi:oligopeptidase B [Catellatospora sp. TT07R-123]|uniref:S9 family peptidase n=1 Tax=Catellatospora sp. TT07R-123 TaxID=2733863 RepID=UPI001B12B0F7|nr:S9 family peptidase [Catellatospora sp. TT07R-123]GHJ50599.1 oligopeptidase B [Catellatospora sp. TT07R-123]
MTSDLLGAPGKPPVAQRMASTRSHHGDDVLDEYAWLEVKEDPAVLDYLKAENAWTDAATAHLSALRDTLFNEIKGRTQETDLSVPVRKGSYWYYSRTEEGRQYSIFCRRAVAEGETAPPIPPDGAPLAGEEILLDGNKLAEGHDYFSLGTYNISPDGRLLAYSTDFDGSERFTLRVKDLASGDLLPDEVADTFYGSAWSLDGSTLFYLTVDEAWRPHKVWRHAVGTTGADELVFEEPDERFWIGVELGRSQRFIHIDVHSKITSEVWLIPADRPGDAPQVIKPRVQGLEYSVESQGDRLLILHNRDAEDFSLAEAPVDDPADWRELIAHEPGVRLDDVDAFHDLIVVSLRRDGLTGLRLLPSSGDPVDLSFPEPLYTVGLSVNPDYHAGQLRLGYASMVTPDSIYDYDLATGALLLRKQKPVLPGPSGVPYDATRYEQHRVWATAEDGTRVPMSVVCAVGTKLDGANPCLLYGYGSYESSMDPWFSIPRLSLLDRGVVYAVAHVRGGGELGRHWYDEGKMLHKRNTFTDFVACARHLAASGWTSADRIVARGGSAGGLLMGAIANLAPDAFTGIVAQVPFVDPLSSILDPSLPLTVTEWEEWGNPLEDADVYSYMKGYSPYENVADLKYPAILAVTSLNDTRVRYSEPAKWIAKLRATAAAGDYLLKTELGAGHSGPSGRYDAWKEEAFVGAWTLDRFGLAG